MSEKLHLFAYDIADARRLSAALRIVRGVAHGGQKSFYECWLSAAERARRLDQLLRLIDPHTDRIFAVELDRRCPTVALGRATPPANPDVILVE